MIVGITGHQDLSKFDQNWIISQLKTFLKTNVVQYGITSLAVGADQLFAIELLGMNIGYEVVIPCANYTSTFTQDKNLKIYTELLKASLRSSILDFPEPSEKAFYTAGIEIVKNSTLILAIWDGKKAKGLGGTADIVESAIQHQKPVFHINPLTQRSEYLNYD